MREAMQNPKLRFALRFGGKPLLDLLKYHFIPRAVGSVEYEVFNRTFPISSNALLEIFSEVTETPVGAGFYPLAGVDGTVTVNTALPGYSLTFKRVSRSLLSVLSATAIPTTRLSPITSSRSFTSPAAQVLVVDKVLTYK
jgi:hypothetical protein